MVREATGETISSAAVGGVDLVSGRVPNRIMLLPIGQLEPRDGRKPWRIEDKAHAEDVVAATRKRLGKTHFMIDYDHQSSRAPKLAGRALAAGWADPEAITVEDDGIYADVEWTAAARSELQDRQYRYISPEFGHTKDGRITRLFTAALTNTPALEMAAVASSQHESNDGDEDTMKAVIAKLGLPAEADETAVVAKIGELQASASLTAIATALKLSDDASREEIATAASAAAGRDEVDLKPLAIALGEAEDATVEKLATAAAELKAGKIDLTKFVPIETYDALKAKVEKGDEERVTAAVDGAIAAGKIPPANRDFYIASASKDFDAFQGFVDKAPVVLKPGEEGVDQAALRTGTLTDEEKAICASLGVTEEKYLETKKEIA